MRSSDTSEQIRQEWRQLQLELSEIRLLWNDSVLERFKTRFFDPWEEELLALLHSLESLEDVMRRIDDS